MDANPMKKVKVLNSPVPRLSIMTVDELNSGKKLINKLNHDCLAKVLSYVPAPERLEMEKVCQKWKEATEFSWYLSKELNFYQLMITLDKREKILETTLSRCCRYLTHLAIVGDQYPWMCNFLKNNCQKITNFYIDRQNLYNEYNIPNEDFVEIIKSMKKLKNLEVKMHHLDSGNFCNEILERLPSDMKKIHLDGSNANTCGIKGITASILGKFNCLQSLTLKRFPLTNATLKEILSSKNSLVELDLSYCKFPSNAQSTFSNLNNLEHLNLYMVENFNVKEILSIAHNCPKLKHFEMYLYDEGDHPKRIAYKIFDELARLNLENLQFCWDDKYMIPDRNRILNFPSNWDGLKDLKLNSNLLFNIQEITRFKNLEYLVLSGVEIDSKSFIKITSNCLELKVLMMDFERLPESALEKLENLKKLEMLNLNFCDNLTGNVLSRIVSNCKDLECLDICGCCNLTDASLIQLGELEHLRGLNMSWIDHLPNAMFDNFYKLESLLCSGCLNVNDEDIMKVIDNCPKLYELHVCATEVTVKSLVHASKRKFVIKKLVIHIDSSIEEQYREQNLASSPYLQIEVEEYN